MFLRYTAVMFLRISIMLWNFHRYDTVQINRKHVKIWLYKAGGNMEFLNSYTALFACSDDVKKQLMIDLEDSKTNNSEVKRLESILASLEQEMSSTKDQLIESETQLNQEQAITKSLTKRTEVLAVEFTLMYQLTQFHRNHSL